MTAPAMEVSILRDFLRHFDYWKGWTHADRRGKCDLGARERQPGGALPFRGWMRRSRQQRESADRPIVSFCWFEVAKSP